MALSRFRAFSSPIACPNPPTFLSIAPSRSAPATGPNVRSPFIRPHLETGEGDQPDEAGAREVGPGEIGADDDRPIELGAREVASREIGIGQIGSGEICASEICPTEV